MLGPETAPSTSAPPASTPGPAGSRPAVALVAALRENLGRVFVGPAETVDRVLVALLAEGHLLVEDVPGVGKTTLAKALARSIACGFKRVQFTPDLLPSDVVGVSVWDQAARAFEFRPGPVFTNVLLADEVNRTSPRTQSCLLEAMSEPAVTVDGVPHALPRPFLVVATQNPFEFEGTYPLPESQLDRFLLRLRVGYPSAAQEREVLRAQALAHPLERLAPVVDAEDVLRLQAETRAVRVDDALVDWVVALAQRSRAHPAFAVGVSPRGALALRRAAQALALVRGRTYAVPDDVRDLVVPALAHRVLPAPGVAGSGEEALARLLEDVPVPV